MAALKIVVVRVDYIMNSRCVKLVSLLKFLLSFST